MLRRIFMASTMVLALGIGFSFAAEVELTAAEIETALAGNTIDGDWGGKYKQYFRDDGFTMYAPEGGSMDEGKWRVNAENNTYDSWWASTGWTPYKVSRDGDTFYWHDKSGKYPFTVAEGKQITW